MTAQEHIAKFRQATGRLPSQVELSRDLGISPRGAVAELLKFVREPVPPAQETVPPGPSSMQERRKVNPLAIGLYSIAALTFTLSVYFTALWFLTMFGIFIAGVISVSMVSYMVLSPQAAMRVKGLVKIPLWAAFLVAMVFSMGSTVAGQYNKYTQNVDVSGVAERAVLDILRAEESEILSGIATDREQQEYHQRTLETLAGTAEDRIMNQAYVATERSKVNQLASSIEAREKRLNEVRVAILAEIRGGNIGVTEDRDDFYGLVSGIFGLSRKQAEFAIAALPAVFIDVIATLAMSLAILVGQQSGGTRQSRTADRGALRRTETTPA